MSTTIFQPIHTTGADPDVVVQGTHTPAELVRQSGVWIDTAGRAFLSQEEYMLAPCDAPLWLVADEDSFEFCHGDMKMTLQRGECVIVPARIEGCTLRKAKDARILWLVLGGPLMENFMRQMNAYNRLPARQGMLPTQVGQTRKTRRLSRTGFSTRPTPAPPGGRRSSRPRTAAARREALERRARPR